MLPTLVILGRPNVGKSTLFNRLVGRKIALVDDTPGVTRDRRQAEGHLGDLSFRVLDTAGNDVHLIANKAEGHGAEPGLIEAYELGFDEPIAISAEHGLGMVDLHAIV